MKPPQPVPIEEVLAQRDWVRRVARGLVAGAADQDDVEQETWLRAVRRPPHAGGSLRGWLARVARSVRIDALRADRQRRERERRVARREPQSVADVVAHADTFRAVVEAVYALDEPQRTVVLLRYFEDLPVSEIAGKLSLDEEAVRSRLRRALARMRERLDEASGGDRSAWLGAVAGVAGMRSQGVPVSGASAAAAVAGGILMSATKVAAAVAVLAVLGWWAWREADTATGTGPGADSSAALDAASAEVRVAPPHAKPRVRSGDQETDSAGNAPAGDATAAGGLAPPAPPPEAGDAELVELTRRVVDERGALVVGATVRVFEVRDPGNFLVPGAEIASTARTDANGSFTARVARGARSLVAVVSVEGFVDAQAPIAEGESVLRVRLLPAWTLRGVVVARETSQPVAGISLFVLRAGSDDVVGGVSTDREGTFVVEKVPAEPLDVRVEDPMEMLDVGRTLADVEPARRPRFAPARVTRIAPHSGELRIELAPALSIEGRLVDARGNPVRTRVSLSVIGRTAQGGPDYSVRRFVDISDEKGAFRVDGLGEGLYDLAFEPSPEGAASGEAAEPVGTAYVPSIAAGTRDLTVVLAEGAPLRVRVVDADGNPAQGGYVYVSESGRNAGEHGTVIARPVDEGVLVTPPLDRAKSFDLLVTGFTSSLQAKRQGVRPGAEEVVVKLERAGRITGQVTDEDGRAVGARVPVRASAQGGVAPGPGTAWIAYTDPMGRFALDALGDHAFTLAAGGGDSGLVAAAEVRDVRIGREDVVLRVRLGVELTGRLRDAAGRPVRTHQLAAHAIGPGAGASKWSAGSSTRIDGDDGRFTLRSVPPGRVRLYCLVGGRVVELGEFDAPAKDLELTLPER